MDIIESVKSIENEIITWRRELHQIPEHSFDLYKTSAYLRKKLEEFNIKYKVSAETGIIATIYGVEEGPTIGIRADMDALPIKEETNLSFKSNNEYMHACGHDAHMAMLLGVAKIISENRARLIGNVRLIFQPAEETTGGARIMIDEGCLEDPEVDVVLGLHIGELFEGIEKGRIGVKIGGMMAAVDSFLVRVNGKGGHGGMPHRCIDPVLISSEMIVSLQKIVSREINPTHPVVITTGMIHGGRYANIIPEYVEFKGTVRTLYDEDRDLVENRVKEILHNIAITNRTTAEITYKRYYPSVINDARVTKELAQAAQKIIGEENVIEINDPVMGAEDMSYYLREVPGTFFILGSSKKNEDGIIYPHHNPKFDIDEDVLWIGTAIFVQFVYDYGMR